MISKEVTRLTSFDEASRYLQRFHGNLQTNYSIDNMVELMDYLGNPQDSFKTIHVAGTSGKTSTAYYLSALLTASGPRTGLTISPHVDSLSERLQINGQPLTERAFCRALSELTELIEEAPVKPSRFELMIALAFWYFKDQAVDYAVIEVGMGGLKDATNVINRPDKVCVITDIGLDHTSQLGDSLAAIAEQKAGIIKPRSIVFSYKQTPSVNNVFETVAKRQTATLNLIDEAIEPSDSLPAYQARNWQLAYSVYRHVAKTNNLRPLSASEIQAARQTFIPGRMDIRRIRSKTLVMDGAHNGQKMAAFVDSFKQLFPGVKPAILIGLRAGKNYEPMVKLLSPLASRLITTNFESSPDLPIRSIPAGKLARAFKDSVLTESQPKLEQAVDQLFSGDEAVLVITGSLYLIGQIRQAGLLHD